MFVTIGAVAAFASQSQPVEDLEGQWDLTCLSAELTVHLGLAGTSAGIPVVLEDTLVVPLNCDLDRREADVLARDTRDGCLAAGIPLDTCLALARDVRDTAVEWSAALAPHRLALDVSETDAFGQLVGVYPATATLRFRDGREEAWPYLIDNNDGTRGQLGAVGVAIDAASDPTLGLGCLVAGAATSVATIDPTTMDLAWGLDGGGTMICAVDLGGGNLIAGDITLGFSVDADGVAR